MDSNLRDGWHVIHWEGIAAPVWSGNSLDEAFIFCQEYTGLNLTILHVSGQKILFQNSIRKVGFPAEV